MIRRPCGPSFRLHNIISVELYDRTNRTVPKISCLTVHLMTVLVYITLTGQDRSFPHLFDPVQS